MAPAGAYVVSSPKRLGRVPGREVYDPYGDGVSWVWESWIESMAQVVGNVGQDVIHLGWQALATSFIAIYFELLEVGIFSSYCL